MAPTERYLLGLDVGGTKLAAVIADESGRILHKERQPTESSRGPEAIVADLVTMLERVCTQVGIGLRDATKLGVSFGGGFDTQAGVAHVAPNLPGWEDFPVRAKLQAALPDIPLVIENDANAAALAEWAFGAGRGKRVVLYLTMGTGIGGGIVADGRIFRGATDFAGEIGHTCLLPEGPTCGCGRRGCLEALCSGPSIARRAAEKIREGMDTGDLGGGAHPTTEEIVAAARRGNAFALRHLRETAHFMAHGIGTAVTILNPDVVVIGTVATAAGELFFGPLREYLPRFAVPPSLEAVQVVPAQLGDMVGDYAAIALVLGGPTEMGAEDVTTTTESK